jgi:hypothetical protein
MSDLNTAIQLIREGQKEAAQKILEPMLRADTANIQAWFWYVETYSTLEKRIQVLETCLKMNPGNPQVMQALETLNSRRPAQTASFAPPPAQSPKPEASQPPASYSSFYDEPPQSPGPFSNEPAYLDESPVYTPIETGTSGQLPPGKQKKAWEEDASSYVDNSMLSKPKPAAKSYAFYDVWMTVLASLDIESYENVLNDPEAGAGRAFEWVAYAGIISGLIAPLSLMSNARVTALRTMPEFGRLFGNMGTPALILIFALILGLVTPILSILGLAISAGIQNLLAGLFGGKGYFGRTAYALAAYLAPMTILIALLGIIPFVGQCLTSLLGLYNIILNVRALRAAHSISVWQALGVMITPTVIFIVLGCLLVFAVGLPGVSK